MVLISLTSAQLFGDEGGGLSSTPAAALDAHYKKWQGIWTERCDEADLGSLPQDRRPTVASATTLRKVALSFKRQTCKVDGWHPRQFGHLSDAALGCLGLLFAHAEWACRWFTEQESLLVRLIPKANGDLRPILLFRSVFRLWSRTARARVASWAKRVLTHPALNNCSGRRCGDGVCARRGRIGRHGPHRQ